MFPSLLTDLHPALQMPPLLTDGRKLVPAKHISGRLILIRGSEQDGLRGGLDRGLMGMIGKLLY